MSGERFPKTKAELSDAKIGNFISGLFLFVSISLVIFELARMTYEWLKYGESSKILLSSLLDMPILNWIGAQKVISYIWGMQIFWIAFLTVILSGWLWGYFSEEVQRLEALLSDKKLQAELKDRASLETVKRS